MPNNRNAQLRYQIIDRCLRNRGRQWTWYNILEKVNEGIIEDNPKSEGVSKITFYEDLKDIEYRIYNLEIERIKNGKTTYLRYLNPNDSINNQSLTDTETKLLKSAIRVISRFKGIPQFDWIHEIIPILELKMGLLNSEREIISFDSNIDYSGFQHISTLIDAILNKRVLELKYNSFKTDFPIDIIIHPQYLKQYNSRWFIMSFMEKYGDKPTIHALDRMVDIQELEMTYFTIPNFDWDDYFSDMIGVTKFDSSLIEVKLLIVDKEQAEYIKTKPLHQTQLPIKKVEGGYETSIKVIPNYELEQLILSFGERIKVLSPIPLRDKIKERINKLNSYY